ncbi:MAG TPA: hypothetical protein VD913_05095, partial [bacterium]|nr:hypothetical protein [bacterium]
TNRKIPTPGHTRHRKVMQKYKGLFLNEKGEKVNGRFDAPGDAELRDHLARKGWKILSLCLVRQVKDPAILTQLERYRQRTLSYMGLGTVLFLAGCALLLLREEAAQWEALWTALLFIWALAMGVLAFVWLRTRCPYCRNLVHKPFLPFSRARWLFREHFMRCDHCNIDFTGEVEIPVV